MEIKLKANNVPTTPGYYLFRNQYLDTPVLVKIQVTKGTIFKLEIISYLYTDPLAPFETDVLWSDRLEIVW